MIHVPSVAQLVDHEVADDLGALEHQAHVQADRALSRARAPARALPTDHHAAEIKTDFPRERVQARTDPHFLYNALNTVAAPGWAAIAAG